MIKIKVYIIFLISLISCIPQPDAPDENYLAPEGRNGVMILCQGNWKMNNSTISIIDNESGNVTNEYFRKSNNSQNLGDTGNDIVLIGDTVLASISTSNSIESFRLSDGKSLGRITFNRQREPRTICVVQPDRAFASMLYDSSLVEFNPKTMEIINDYIPTGPAPEDLLYFDNKLFVANSGFGDYLAGRPKAGTISVIDLNSLIEEKLLPAGPNVTKLEINRSAGLLYAMYLHLPSEEDSLGGIVEYDLFDLEEIRRWRVDATEIELSLSGDSLFYIENNDIFLLKLTHPFKQPEKIIDNPDDDEFWYSIEISPYRKHIWIANARNYQIDGEILLFDLDTGTMIKTFSVGINPSVIRFF